MAKEELSEKISITVPPAILREIDELVRDWYSSRSGVFTRVYLEWKQSNLRQLPLVETREVEKA